MAEHNACGPEGFGKYGAFNVIWGIATTYNLTPLEAEGVALSYAILTFRYQADTAKYSEELNRLMAPKK